MGQVSRILSNVDELSKLFSPTVNECSHIIETIQDVVYALTGINLISKHCQEPGELAELAELAQVIHMKETLNSQ